MEFLVKRDDLHETRFEDDAGPPELERGQALLEVDSFGLTTNNITYAVMGDAMNYWKFFPAPEGWGRVPMWGFADVADPGDTDLEEGARIYGYLPPSTHLVVEPEGVDERGFVDASPHRAELPSAYQAYRRTDGAASELLGDRDDELMLFWPLFYTSWLIDDFLADSDFFGAETMVLSSASSKTAIIAAFMLAQREGISVVGLTSASNAKFVEGLGVYDAAVSYEDIGDLPDGGAVYVDMSGSAEVRQAVHERYGDDLRHDAVVGTTHRDELGGVDGLPGPRPQFFFAPTWIKKRSEDWGGAGVDERVMGSWAPFAEWTEGWLEVRRGVGPDGLRDAYLEVLDGKVPPQAGHVVKLAE